MTVPEINIVVGLVIILHSFDFFLTLKILENFKHEKDWWENEINYHKYFFKWFGLEKGGAISFAISLSLVTGVCSLLIKTQAINAAYLFLGMNLAVVYLNYMTMLHADKMKKKRDSECNSENGKKSAYY